MVLTCSSKEVTRGWMRSSAKEPTSLSVSAGSDGSPAAISSSTWRETTRATSSEVTCVTKALSAAVSPLRSSARSALYRSIRVFWSTDASVESARSRSLMSMAASPCDSRDRAPHDTSHADETQGAVTPRDDGAPRGQVASQQRAVSACRRERQYTYCRLLLLRRAHALVQC